ncbi:MAG TPA: hypothetical protein PLA50_19745 [Bacteroidia bacterium]|nr:hypothetical protein [Bacteroidia bacterium]
MRAGVLLFCLLPCLAAAEKSDVFVFTGSFWERGDSFVLKFVLDETPARVEWDGHGENQYDRDKPDKNRIRLSFALTEAEDQTFRGMAERFHWCRSKRVSLGTGLSLVVRRTRDGKPVLDRHYFAVESNERLARLAEEVPLHFQRLAMDGEFSDGDRASFFDKVAALSRDLADYDTACESLERCRIEKTPVPWDRIAGLVVKPYPEHDAPEAAGQRSKCEAEAALVIDTLLREGGLEHRPSGSPPPAAWLVTVGAISVETGEAAEYSYFEVLPEAIASPSPRAWQFLNPALLEFIEDYVAGSEKVLEFFLDHDFQIVSGLGEPVPAQLERAAFFKGTGFRSFVVPEAGVDEAKIGHFQIARIAFEQNMTRCSVGVRNGDSTWVALLELDEAQWRFLRRVSWDDWEKYGWKEPPPFR